MEAGRELDALIAEKVMGFTVKGGLPISAWPPHYSADIAAAWEVVKKMGRHEISIHMRSDSNTDRVTKRYYIMDYTCRALLAEANTAPHAICLAALKAIEHV